MVHSDTITVFNYYESATMAVWYPHTIPNVHVDMDRASMLAKYGAESKDSFWCSIPTDEDGNVTDANGNRLQFLQPKEWEKLPNAEQANAITFNPVTDFIFAGEYPNEKINESDYLDRVNEGFYSYMNERYDSVFKISNVAPYKLIPHIEITGS